MYIVQLAPFLGDRAPLELAEALDPLIVEVLRQGGAQAANEVQNLIQALPPFPTEEFNRLRAEMLRQGRV